MGSSSWRAGSGFCTRDGPRDFLGAAAGADGASSFGNPCGVARSRSVRALLRHIELYLERWNANPTPFVWTKTPAEITKKAVGR